MTKLTINEIAKLAGVSPATASRVLNNHPSVGEDLRKRVMKVIEEHGYVPSAAARSLAKHRTDIVGLLLPHGDSSAFRQAFYATMISEIVKACIQRDRLVAVLPLPDAQSQKKLYDRVLHGGQLDGVILLAPDMDEPLLPLLIKDGVPFVMFGRHLYLKNITWVDVDNRGAAYQLVSHLIRLGRRRIATIAGSSRTAWGTDRLDGYKQALVENGIPLDPELILGDGRYFTQKVGYEKMKRLLALPNRPDAVFTANDYMAFGAYNAIKEAGLRVPEDISLVCFDEFAQDSFDIGMTTVPQPFPLMAETSVQLLVDQIDNPGHPPVQKVLPMQMVVRESCGARLALGKEALEERTVT